MLNTVRAGNETDLMWDKMFKHAMGGGSALQQEVVVNDCRIRVRHKMGADMSAHSSSLAHAGQVSSTGPGCAACLALQCSMSGTASSLQDLGDSCS